MLQSQANSKNQEGFVLIDSMIGIVILTVALLAIASMFVQGSMAHRASLSRSDAYNYAQEKVEELKNRTAAEWTTAVPAAQTTYILATESRSLNNITFTCVTQARTATTDTAVTGTNINTKLIHAQVTVTWTDAKTGSQSSVVNTYFERN